MDLSSVQLVLLALSILASKVTELQGYHRLGLKKGRPERKQLSAYFLYKRQHKCKNHVCDFDCNKLTSECVSLIQLVNTKSSLFTRWS